MSVINLLLSVAILIIVVLASIAARLIYKVYRMNQLRSQQFNDLAKANMAAQEKQKERANKSIQILAQALHQDELTLTEASIRISHILDQLDVDAVVKAEFSAFYQLRERTEHIPIMNDWKNLSSKEQRVYEKERLQQEATYYDFVKDAARRILGRQF